jgi:hypothetical protein
VRGALGDSSRTDFTALSGTFAFRNGVAQTGDLQMAAPTLNITDVGSVDLATRQVDFHRAQGAARRSGGKSSVTFCVKETIDNPSFDPDLSGLAAGLVRSARRPQGCQHGRRHRGKALAVPGNAIKSRFGRN